jgi:hypothetical protein
MPIVEARRPDGTLSELVEVNLTQSGLLIMITDMNGNQTLIPRAAWDGVVCEVNKLLQPKSGNGAQQ